MEVLTYEEAKNLSEEEKEKYRLLFEMIGLGDRIPEVLKPQYSPNPCKACTNHPTNGGNGICQCTLGTIQWT